MASLTKHGTVSLYSSAVFDQNRFLAQLNNVQEELMELIYGNGLSASQSSQMLPVRNNSSENFQSEESHDASKVTKYFTCNACGRKFKEAFHYTKHKRGVQCFKAQKKKYRKKNKYEREIAEAQNKANALYKPFCCVVCDAKFCDRGNVEIHVERQHHTKQPLWFEMGKNSELICQSCDRWFQDKETLAEHHKEHTQINNLALSTKLNEATLSNRPILANSYSCVQVNMPTYFNSVDLSPNLVQNVPSIANSSMVFEPGVNNVATVCSEINTPVATCTKDTNLCQMSVPIINYFNGLRVLKGVKIDDAIADSKWNVCGDCGHRFMDKMNLELHFQRKHPESYITEVVNLGGWTSLYKTNNTTTNIEVFSSNKSDEKVTAVKSNIQSFNCLLCAFSCKSILGITKHLWHVHNTNNTNMMTTENSTKKNTKRKISGLTQNLCSICNKSFSLKTELAKHKCKVKKIECKMCCYSSFNAELVKSHTELVHKPHCSDNSFLSDVHKKGAFSCWICGLNYFNAVTFSIHLHTHGKLNVECKKCGAKFSSVDCAINHIKESHTGESCSISLIIITLNQPPLEQVFFISSTGNVDNVSSSEKNKHLQNNLSVGASQPCRSVGHYLCTFCKLSFIDVRDFERHLCSQQPSLSIPNFVADPLVGSNSVSNPITPHANSLTSKLKNGIHLTNSMDVDYTCNSTFCRENSDIVSKHIQIEHMTGSMLQSVPISVEQVPLNPLSIAPPF